MTNSLICDVIYLKKITVLLPIALALTAVSEEEFYRRQHPQSNARGESPEGSTVEIRLPPSPPSPQSLQQQHIEYAEEGDPDYNPHKKLTHVSSLSAPEVNQVGHSIYW